MTPVEQIELVLLNIMDECTPDEYRFGYFFSFRYFERATQMDKELIRGFMRSMRNRGLVEWGHGFDEDGFTAGAGYTLTPVGAKHLEHLKLQLTLQREQLKEQMRMRSPGEVMLDMESWKGTNYG